jgi:ABC-type multidrug transport system fused ATPase/permease subunit
MDVRDYPVAGSPQQGGHGAQNNVLFSGTIRENLPGVSGSNGGGVVAGGKNAQAYDFIMCSGRFRHLLDRAR